MQVETRFTLFGYPGLAIVLFLVAASGGLWLVFNTFRSDSWGIRVADKATKSLRQERGLSTVKRRLPLR